SPYNLGRTGTHEFGHCFNLLHIWGDDGTACTGTDQCSDTPNQAGEHYGCFAQGSVQTDGCTTTSPGVMWMNYMDYTDDACMYMFTAQQCARMEAVVNTAPWNVLQNSNGCTPVTALDAGITSVLAPVNSSSTCVNNVTPKVTLANAGSTTLTSAKVLYKMDAAATQTLSWSGSLASGTSTVLTLNSFTGLTTAAHTFSVWVTAPNAGTDQNAANNSMVSNFTVATAPVGATLPFTEGFENTTFPPTGWQLLRAATVNTATTWSRLANTTGLTAGSTAIAKMDNFSSATSIAGQLDALKSPALNFSTANSSLKVKFDVAHRKYGTSIDTLNVYISTDCGSSWTRLYTKGGTQLATVTTSLSTAFTPTSNAQWRRDSISLSAYAGQASVYLKFESRSGWGNNVYLDNINVANTAAAAPTASFASVAAQCAGTAIAFTDNSINSPTSWAWSMPGASPSTYTVQNPTATYTASGTYTVSLTATNSTGSSTPYTQVITINPKPTVAVASSTICAGATATITASGASTYLWNTGVSGASLSNSPTATTPYTVTGTSALSCTNVATGTITVKALPTVAATSGTVCAGNNSVLTASGASTYTWTSGPSTANYTVTPTATTVYTVTGTGSNGCVNTKTTSVTVNALPSTAVISATICAGSTGTLSASGATTYSWNTGATTANISASPAGTTNYTVTGTTAAGCVKTATGSITVGSAPAISLSSATVCAGSSVVLSASGVTSYTWTSGPNTSTYSVTPTATTVYTVSGNLTGCTAAAVKTATVTVNTIPNVTASSATICAGATATLTSAGASTYAWNTGATTANINVSPTGTTMYTVTGTSAVGCSKTITAAVTVNVLPNVTVGSATICSGSSANLTASGASTYVWNTGATGSGLNVSPTTTTTYTVTGTSAASCVNTAIATVNVVSAPAITVNSSSVCAGSPAVLSASGVTTYTWNTGSNSANLSVSPTVTTVYTVTGNLSGCSTQASQTATVMVNPLPIVGLTTATNKACVNNSPIALTGTPTGGTYSGIGVSGNAFNPTTAGAGTYTLSYNYTNGNGCSASANAVIIVDLCTGIEEINNGELIIYPNPAKETLTIKLATGLVGNTTVELYDAIGKLVISHKATDATTTLSVENLAKGMYTLRVISDNNQTVRRIMKE
ncbi:MAG: T9SS type A sorting domain-containing protein, partial [Bacteroidota bacterium]